MSLAIACRNLIKTYPARKEPVHAVRGLDLEVERGECFGLLGPNGAGKTTTIEILEGLLAPTSGDVEVLGEHWTRDNRPLRQKIGITLQSTQLSEKLTVRETTALFRSFYDQGHDPMAVLDQVGLVEKQDAYVGKLSGGQKQRLAIACALVGEPELLFLDEPTTGLDPQSRRQLWDIIRKLKSQGRTILITTHYMDEAEKLCDRVAVVDLGKVIALGSPAELIARLGGDQLIEFQVEGNGVSVGGSTAGGPVLPVDELRNLAAVASATRSDEGYQIGTSAVHKTLPALLEWLQIHNVKLAQLTTRHASLEDVFVQLTGKHLRDDA